ncbi:hypothetical protein [Nocardia sp. CS682]|uniref:hypothetical protein n=1 Tax=Nocardia sp. CS682 TaxID=1047172 RepID=UPI001075511C|nr:hypothetical protein [Nocardia sp. CS682]QBS41288.1 hypothetical protein DMB37_15325 [Nocardia sp. CS682]
MTTIPAGSAADLAEQQAAVYDFDVPTGLDETAIPPLAERIRDAFEAADITDRIEQSLITPLPDDDYPFAY